MQESYEINDFDELVELLRNSSLDVNQCKDIVCQALKVVFIFDYTKDEFIDEVQLFWNKYGNAQFKPPFGDSQLCIDVIED